jgi:hypothetical protein
MAKEREKRTMRRQGRQKVTKKKKLLILQNYQSMLADTVGFTVPTQ